MEQKIKLNLKKTKYEVLEWIKFAQDILLIRQ